MSNDRRKKIKFLITKHFIAAGIEENTIGFKYMLEAIVILVENFYEPREDCRIGKDIYNILKEEYNYVNVKGNIIYTCKKHKLKPIHFMRECARKVFMELETEDRNINEERL